mgnify:CR=1 FL=1
MGLSKYQKLYNEKTSSIVDKTYTLLRTAILLAAQSSAVLCVWEFMLGISKAREASPASFAQAAMARGPKAIAKDPQPGAILPCYGQGHSNNSHGRRQWPKTLVTIQRAGHWHMAMAQNRRRGYCPGSCPGGPYILRSWISRLQ